MAIEFDGDNLLITLDTPVAGVLNQTWEEVYDEFKQWFLQGENSAYPFAFTVSGGEPVTDVTIAGQYYFLRNDLGWRIRTTDEDQDVFWSGNGIPTDLTLPIVTGRAGRTIAHFGLQPLVTGISGLTPTIGVEVADIHGQVQRAVFINTEALVNGNGYQQTPYNNFTDAADYAEANGLQILRLQADADLDRNLANFELLGIDLPTFDLQGFSASSLIVRECTVTGVQGGPQFPLLCLVCNIRDLIDFNGSMLTVTVETRIRIADGAFCLINEVIPAIGGSPWELDMGAGGAASTVQLQNISGGLNVTNMDNASDGLHMAFKAGAVTIDATCTAGSIVISGAVKVTDNSGPGCTVDVSATDRGVFFAHLIESGFSFEEIARILASHAAGKVNQPVEGGAYQFRNLNDTKDVIEGDDTATGGRDITAIDAT
jgi:hypothetical protein